MRDLTWFHRHLDELERDIYPQPTDPGHTEWCKNAIATLVTPLRDVRTVLDVGCGQCVAQPFFADLGIIWNGVTLGEEDFLFAKRRRYNVGKQDFHFLNFYSESFDMVFSRHSLEHSPMPLLALMEWNRVSRKYLCLIVPTPEGWGTAGRNHYAVYDLDQLRWLLTRAGWKITSGELADREYWILCEKVERPVPFHAVENAE